MRGRSIAWHGFLCGGGLWNVEAAVLGREPHVLELWFEVQSSTLCSNFRLGSYSGICACLVGGSSTKTFRVGLNFVGLLTCSHQALSLL